MLSKKKGKGSSLEKRSIDHWDLHHKEDKRLLYRLTLRNWNPLKLSFRDCQTIDRSMAVWKDGILHRRGTVSFLQWLESTCPIECPWKKSLLEKTEVERQKDRWKWRSRRRKVEPAACSERWLWADGERESREEQTVEAIPISFSKMWCWRWSWVRLGWVWTWLWS